MLLGPWTILLWHLGSLTATFVQVDESCLQSFSELLSRETKRIPWKGMSGARHSAPCPLPRMGDLAGDRFPILGMQTQKGHAADEASDVQLCLVIGIKAWTAQSPGSGACVGWSPRPRRAETNRLHGNCWNMTRVIKFPSVA